MSKLDRAKDLLLLASVSSCIFLLGRASKSDLRASPGLAVEPAAASVSPAAVKLALPQGRSTKRGKTAAGLGLSKDMPLMLEGSGGTASASNGFLAVTGSYGVGTSVLYVIDTMRRQIAVYEARGGSQGSRRLSLVGARRIDLDLQLEGYNDQSEYSYSELARRIAKARSPVSTPAKRASKAVGGAALGVGGRKDD